MAPRGDISRPQRWDPDEGPWEEVYRGVPGLSVSVSVLFCLSLSKLF